MVKDDSGISRRYFLRNVGGLGALVGASSALPLLQSCTNYFRGATPGVEIGNDAVEKNCSTHFVESLTMGDLELYHLGFLSKNGEIEHGFYRTENSKDRIDPSCGQTPEVRSNEKRNNVEGLYFLVPAAEKTQEARITLKDELNFPKPKSREKTSVLSLNRRVHKSYDLNELFRDNRVRLPGDKHSYFVFPFSELTAEITQRFNSTITADGNSPEYLPVVLIDTSATLVIDNKTGKASFVDKDNKRSNRIKVLKFYTEEGAKKNFKLGR